jgi:hypothetical protein
MGRRHDAQDRSSELLAQGSYCPMQTSLRSLHHFEWKTPPQAAAFGSAPKPPGEWIVTPPAGAAPIPTNGTPPDGCPSGMRWGEDKGGWWGGYYCFASSPVMVALVATIHVFAGRMWCSRRGCSGQARARRRGEPLRCLPFSRMGEGGAERRMRACRCSKQAPRLRCVPAISGGPSPLPLSQSGRGVLQAPSPLSAKLKCCGEGIEAAERRILTLLSALVWRLR